MAEGGGVTDMQAVVLWNVVYVDRRVVDSGVPGCNTLQRDIFNCQLCNMIFRTTGVFSITALQVADNVETYVLRPSLFWKIDRRKWD